MINKNSREEISATRIKRGHSIPSSCHMREEILLIDNSHTSSPHMAAGNVTVKLDLPCASDLDGDLSMQTSRIFALPVELDCLTTWALDWDCVYNDASQYKWCRRN